MLSNQEIILRLFLATLLGGLVGLERERLDWAAGLRTHMLVCIGSAVIMLVSSFGFADVLGHSGVVLDPARIAAQVVSGIGFLGAGTIILRRKAIRGLTTAAGLWVVAAIGLAIGGGLYLIGISSTLIVLAILIIIKPFERRLFTNRRPQNLNLKINRLQTSITEIEAAVTESGLHLDHIRMKAGNSPEEQEVELIFTRIQNEQITSLTDKLHAIEGITEISSTRPRLI